MIFVFIFIGLFSFSSLYSKDYIKIRTDINNTKSTSLFYDNQLKDNNEAFLTLFFTQMPKGGDLHHHYSGSIYVETYLDWISKKGWYINKCTLQIVKNRNNEKCKLLRPIEVMNSSVLYSKLLSVWSDKDFNNYHHKQLAPDTSFFNTFSYFGAISHQYTAKGLNILKKRALKENLSYIETMIGSIHIDTTNFFNIKQIKKYNNLLREAKTQKTVDNILEEITNIYLKDKKFNKTISNYILKLNSYHKGIDNKNFLMRFQISTVRTLSPLNVFSKLFAGYIASKNSSLIVGVNILAPENNPVALSDYTLHMYMYNYLSRKYPKVNRALHAGELTLGMVRPKNLTFHITQAIEIAKAQRIGHGVDIAYEEHSIKLLEEMKKKASVEINFTSNEFILGVKGKTHPYLIYARYGVPIIISTDDSGVSRNNLTHEYLILATRYHPSYMQIKKYVYNSIRYSFLEAKEKLMLIKDLNVRFIIFENKIAKLNNKVLDY